MVTERTVEVGIGGDRGVGGAWVGNILKRGDRLYRRVFIKKGG